MTRTLLFIITSALLISCNQDPFERVHQSVSKQHEPAKGEIWINQYTMQDAQSMPRAMRLLSTGIDLNTEKEGLLLTWFFSEKEKFKGYEDFGVVDIRGKKESGILLELFRSEQTSGKDSAQYVVTLRTKTDEKSTQPFFQKKTIKLQAIVSIAPKQTK